jgi:hypothetical protein
VILRSYRRRGSDGCAEEEHRQLHRGVGTGRWPACGDGAEVAEERTEVVTFAAARDIAKGSGMVCTQTPGSRPDRKRQRVWGVEAVYNQLVALMDHLRCEGIERLVLESTSDYWRIWYHLAEAAGLEVWLVNAKDVNHVPGQGKSDRQDCVWLCKLNERGRLHRIGRRSSVRACRRRSGSRPGLTPQLAVRCGGSPGRFSSGDAASRRLVPSTRRCRRSRSAGPARRRRRTGRPRAAAGRSIAPSRRSAR